MTRIGHLTRGAKSADCGLLRGRGSRGPRANGGRHGGCTPGATHRWVADASASGTTNSRTARIPTFAATHRPLGDIYASDHADTRQSGRFRWLLSTCLAAGVGVLAILVVIAGSTDTREADGGLFASLKGVSDAPLAVFRLPSARVDGLRWAVPKTDRLMIPSGAMATKFVISDPVRQRRGSRDYIMNKPYARLVARLAPISKAEALKVPPFNPFTLYANTTPLDAADRPEDGQQDAAVKIVELLGGIVPSEDGQELGAEEVAEAIARAQAATAEPPALRPTVTSEAQGPSTGDVQPKALRRAPSCQHPTRPCWPNRCSKRGRHRRPRRPRGPGRQGPAWRHADPHPPANGSRDLAGPGHERCSSQRPAGRRAASGPGGARDAGALGAPRQSDGARSFQRVRRGPGSQGHRDAQCAGEFVASASPIDERIARAALVSDDQPQASSLYASLHYTAERQGIPADVILQIFKIHAYETDFRQRVRAGDGFELFFDVKEEDKGADGSLGELLATPSPRPARRTSSTVSAPPTGPSTSTTIRATPRASS